MDKMKSSIRPVRVIALLDISLQRSKTLASSPNGVRCRRLQRGHTRLFVPENHEMAPPRRARRPRTLREALCVIDRLEAENQALRTTVHRLEAKIAALEARLDANS